MFSIYDVDGHKSDLGSTATIAMLENLARRFNLSVFLDFLKEGFTIDMEGLANDLESIDLNNFGELEEVIETLLDTAEKSSEIMIVTDEVE